MPKGYRNLTLASRKRWAESWWVYWYKVSEGLIVQKPGKFLAPHVSAQGFYLPSMYGSGTEWTAPYVRTLRYRGSRP